MGRGMGMSRPVRYELPLSIGSLANLGRRSYGYRERFQIES